MKTASAATTFRSDEVACLDELLALVRRGADAKVIARSAAFASISRKVVVMRATIERLRAIESHLAERHAPDGDA